MNSLRDLDFFTYVLFAKSQHTNKTSTTCWLTTWCQLVTGMVNQLRRWWRYFF